MDLEETEWQFVDFIYVQLYWSLTMVHDSLTLSFFFFLDTGLCLISNEARYFRSRPCCLSSSCNCRFIKN
jgi:hypothetical protein